MNGYTYSTYPFTGQHHYESIKTYDLTKSEHCIELASEILESIAKKLGGEIPQSLKFIRLKPKRNALYTALVSLESDTFCVKFYKEYYFSTQDDVGVETFRTTNDYDLDNALDCKKLIQEMEDYVEFFSGYDFASYNLYEDNRGQEEVVIYLHKGRNEPPFRTMVLVAEIEIMTNYFCFAKEKFDD